MKVRAQELRKIGKTFGEIQAVLEKKIPKSTLSDWCKNVHLPKEYASRLKKINYVNLRRGREAAIRKAEGEKKKNLVSLFIQHEALWTRVDKNIAKMLLATLYLGEGAKRDGLLALGSSDVGIVRLFLKLLKMCYSTTTDLIKCRISYRADQNIGKLTNFWSKQVGIPIENFYRTKPDPRTVGKSTKKPEYMGVCVLHILQSSKIHQELEVISGILTKGR